MTPPLVTKHLTSRVPPVKVIFPRHPPPPSRENDSDSDIEIVDPSADLQKRKEADQKRKEQTILELKKRAGHTGLPPIRKKTRKLTATQLQANLLQQSREQAKLEREERIKELKEKGVYIQTAEERLQDELQVEDLIEKARQEAQKVKNQEKKEKKEERLQKIARGEAVSDDDENDSDDDENDGEWLEKEQGHLYELSGSEEELAEESIDTDDKLDADFSDEENVDGSGEEEGGLEEEEEEGDSRERNPATPTPRLSEMPTPYIDDEVDADDSIEMADAGLVARRSRRKAPRVVDEEDEDMNTLKQQKPATPTPKNPFGIQAGGPPLGLTQMFAGTMADSQVADSNSGLANLDALRKAPNFEMPNSQAPLEFDSQNQGQTQTLPSFKSQSEPKWCTSESETGESQQNSMLPVDLSYSQDKIVYDEGNELNTSQFPDPTPDTGFDAESSPAPQRFNDSPASVRNGDPTQLSQINPKPARKKGRLIRKGEAIVATGREGSISPEKDPVKDAFSVMKLAAEEQKRLDDRQSLLEAKEMIYEQAEESDDEYAGLGGPSDDDMFSDDGKDVAEMIDDDVKDIDESAIAAYYAEKERDDDQKNVNRLFKDLKSGGLRRKRGAGGVLDLSDSEDEEERRRAVRRRNEARLRKLLLEDQNISQIGKLILLLHLRKYPNITPHFCSR